MGAAHWPGSRAHAPQLWPGWSFLQAEMQPLQSWTLQMAGLTEGGMVERVDQTAPRSCSAVSGVHVLLSFTPRWEQLRGTALGPPHGEERGPRLPHPKGRHKPPHWHRLLRLATAQGKGPLDGYSACLKTNERKPPDPRQGESCVGCEGLLFVSF